MQKLESKKKMLMLIVSLVLVEKLPLTSGLHHQGRYGVIVMNLSNREIKKTRMLSS